MGRKLNLCVGSVFLIGVIAFLLGIVFAGSRVSAEPVAHSAPGKWFVAAGDNGYLVNTDTGEVWRMRDNVELAMSTPKPAKP